MAEGIKAATTTAGPALGTSGGDLRGKIGVKVLEKMVDMGLAGKLPPMEPGKVAIVGRGKMG